MPAPFRILALSAGGYQGLFTALILEEIEARGGGPLRDRFDLISGTSIGGVIALAVAAGVPISSVVRAFVEEGPSLFPNGGVSRGRVPAARDALRFLSRPKYDPDPLRDLIGRFIDPATRLRDLGVPVLIPATRVRDAEPVLFGPLTHPGLSVVDAALATAAAPMMFPTHRIGPDAYADGAVFAPAPDLIAVQEAGRRSGAGPGRVRVLSVGTLSGTFRLRAPETDRLGVLGWVSDQRLVRTVLAAQERLTVNACRDLFGPRYLRIDTKGGGH
jgi:patatin-like phospholipase/acyl hydrolase